MSYESLDSGCTVQLRRVARGDLEPLLGFFRGLSSDDRRHLRRDVTDTAVVDSLLREAERGEADRMIALCDDEIVGFAALIFADDDWHRHTGQIRVIVGEKHRRQHLGAILVQAMVDAARKRDVSKVVVKMHGAQQPVRKMFERLGFRIDAVLPEYVVDTEGQVQDLVVMSNSLDDVSKVLRDFCRDDDWLDG
jgi:RimJ/RimL family protein N-acetyltransferase